MRILLVGAHPALTTARIDVFAQPAGKQIVVWLKPFLCDPHGNRISRLIRDLELNGRSI